MTPGHHTNYKQYKVISFTIPLFNWQQMKYSNLQYLFIVVFLFSSTPTAPQVTTPTTPTVSPTPSVTITNRVTPTIPTEFSRDFLILPIGSTFYLCRLGALEIIAEYDVVNPNQETVVTRWSANGQIILMGQRLLTTDIDDVTYDVFGINVAGKEGFLYKNDESKIERLELNNLDVNDFFIIFEVSLGSLTDLETSSVKVEDCDATTPISTSPLTLMTTPTAATTPPTPTPITIATPTPILAPSVTITNPSTAQLPFGIFEGPIGASFMLYVGDSLSVIATYEFQNPNQETVATRWTLNGVDISVDFLTVVSINGREYMRYAIINTGISGSVYRATESNEEFIELELLPAQTDSTICFYVTLGALSDTECSEFNVITRITTATPAATPITITTPTTTGPMIIIIQEQGTIEPDSVQDVSGRIGTTFRVRKESGIRIDADYVINSVDAVESITSWYYHSTVDGTRTKLEFQQGFVPGGFGFIVTNSPWSTNDSYMIFVRRGLRSESLEIISTFPVHEGYFTFRAEVENFPFEEATSEIRLTVPVITTPKPTTLPPTPPPTVCTQPLDIYFAIDMSGSLSATGFFNEINFVIQIIDSFINPRNRFGYLLFNDGFESTTLNSDPEEVKDELRAVQYQGGGTRFLPALGEILNNHFTPQNIRDDSSRILFFLTDGVSGDDQSDVVGVANMLKTGSRVRIATVGFGEANLTALKEIATEGFNFEFDDLVAANQALSELVEISCTPRCCGAPPGYRGERGPMGYRGDMGEAGKNGICETLSDCVLRALKGSPGSMGPPGSNGQRGEMGDNGATGAQGQPGAMGVKGVTGDEGMKGMQGEQGVKGQVGASGPAGQKGMNGATGRKGEEGVQGLKGNTGETGPEGVCTSTACVGLKGEKGQMGTMGEKGFAGRSGTTGGRGSVGNQGITGLKGVNGFPGTKGDTGEVGEAIEKRQFEAGSCAPDGGLFYDTDSDRIFYCSGGRYLCVGNESCNV